MSIGRPYFYLATLLDSAETRALYDRLVLECGDSESELLIPKVRRRSKSARSMSGANLYFVLSEAENSARDDCCDGTKPHKDQVEPRSSDVGVVNEAPASIPNTSGFMRDQTKPSAKQGATAMGYSKPSASEDNL
jgi:hypothetical protein